MGRMLETLRRLWRERWPDPSRTSLTWWLAAINIGLVLLLGGGLTWSASHRLRELGDAQGKARAQLAATTAREDLRRFGDEALVTARTLAERPTLQRLLAEGRHDALPPVLKSACESGGMDACAVLSGNTVIAVAGPAVDWGQIVTAANEQGATFMALPAVERVPVLGASAALAEPAGMRVFVVRRLDDKLGEQLSTQVGAQIKIIDYRLYTSAAVTAYTPLYSAALV